MSKKAWLTLIGIALVVIVLFGAGLYFLAGHGYGFGYGMFGRGMMYGFPFMRGGGMMSGLPFIGGIGMFLFWLLIIVGVVWLIQSSSRGSAVSTPASESPLDVLKRRYASGEINKEQFEEMKNALGS